MYALPLLLSNHAGRKQRKEFAPADSQTIYKLVQRALNEDHQRVNAKRNEIKKKRRK